MNSESEAWVMSDATTTGERLAYLRWMNFTCALVGHGVAIPDAIQGALDQLPANEKIALANLAERVPPGIEFTQIHLDFKLMPGGPAVSD